MAHLYTDDLSRVVNVVDGQIRTGRLAAPGTRRRRSRADHDKIEVPGGTFTALEMGVSDGDVGFERVIVHFRNGGEEVLPVAVVWCSSGGRTPSIPLRGGAREISDVEIWSTKGRFEGKPRVDLFGRR